MSRAFMCRERILRRRTASANTRTQVLPWWFLRPARGQVAPENQGRVAGDEQVERLRLRKAWGLYLRSIAGS